MNNVNYYCYYYCHRKETPTFPAMQYIGKIKEAIDQARGNSNSNDTTNNTTNNDTTSNE